MKMSLLLFLYLVFAGSSSDIDRRPSGDKHVLRSLRSPHAPREDRRDKPSIACGLSIEADNEQEAQERRVVAEQGLFKKRKKPNSKNVVRS